MNKSKKVPYNIQNFNIENTFHTKWKCLYNTATLNLQKRNGITIAHTPHKKQ